MKWIAIKDQLPPVSEYCLFWDGDCCVGYLSTTGNFFTNYSTTRIYPTHWAEITPPESEGTK